MKKRPHFFRSSRLFVLIILTMTFVLTLISQTLNETQILIPGQTLEREMTSAETHRYKFNLKANEFFQVRVEQKGVDVMLRLTDDKANVLATMNSPNGKEGFEILSFIAARGGGFILDVSNTDAKVEKARYIIKRQTSRKADDNDKRRVEIEKLYVEALGLSGKGRLEDSVSRLNKTLQGWSELKDEYFYNLTKQQYDLNSDLLFFNKISIPIEVEKKGQQSYDQGAPESITEARTTFIEALKLYDEFIAELNKREYSKPVQNSTLKADNFLFAKWGKVNLLNGIANTYNNSTEINEKIKYLNLASQEADELLSDKEIQSSKYFSQSSSQINFQKALFLTGLATHLNLSDQDPKNALTAANRALAIFEQIKKENPKNENGVDFQIAKTFGTIGSIYQKLDDFPQAILNLENALSAYQKIPNTKSFEGSVLSSLGLAYFQTFNYQKALENLEKALSIAESNNDKLLQVQLLGHIGIIYFDLGDEEKIRENARIQIPILLSDDYEKLMTKNLNSLLNTGQIFFHNPAENTKASGKPDHDNKTILQENSGFYEILRLMSIGINYKVLNEYEDSLKYYNQALILARSEKQAALESTILGNIGDIYIKQKKSAEAISFFKPSVEIERRLPQKSYLATALRDLGHGYLESGDGRAAIPYLTEALSIWSSIGAADKQNIYRNYATTLAHLARAYETSGDRSLAIYFGKIAVNAIQTEREQLKGFDPILQKKYLDKNDKPYRRLADLLISQGRFAEAEQVLQMLKADEYSKFVRRDPEEIKKLSQKLEANAKEKPLLEKYESYASNLARIGVEVEELEKEKTRQGAAFDKQTLLDEKEKILADAQTAFNKFLKIELVEEFKKLPKKTPDEDKINPSGDIINERSIQGDLKNWNAVSLYTVVGENRYRVVLTTPQIQIDGKTDISEGKLNDKIFAFREALQNPNADPRPLGKELYDILVKPIEKQIEDSKAKTLLWSLDGTLRYIPIAALWDGKQYLIEKYQIVMLTPRTRNKLNAPNNSNRRIFGGGVTKESRVTEPGEFAFGALPDVRNELSTIIKGDGTQGIFAGKKLFDEAFTVKTLEDSLFEGKFNILHFATHFKLGRDNANSFLLLGNNEVLTLDEFDVSKKIKMDNIDLVVLSACQTAFGNAGTNNNGAEVDSLATFVELRGAKSVIASLWPVADKSTSQLMIEFYRRLQANPKNSKAGAMQTAQREMIEGNLKPLPADGRKRTEIVDEKGKPLKDKSLNGQPPYQPDAAKPFAHPYYWSPFVLIGNWK